MSTEDNFFKESLATIVQQMAAMQEAITTLSQEVTKLKKDDAIELNALEQAPTAFAKETQQQTELKNIENQDFEQN